MLLKLMHKDLILHWKGILPLPITALGFLVYAVLRDGGNSEPGFYLTMVALMAGFAPVTVAAREDKLRIRALTCSLPVDRRTVVGARYLGSWIVLAALVAFVIPLLLLLRGPSVVVATFQARTVLSMLTAFTVTTALVMPFVERFGFTGVFLSLIAIQLLGLLVFAWFSVVAGKAAIGPALDAIRHLAADSRARLGQLGYYGVCAVVLVALNLTSFGASVAVLQRREL